MSMQDNRPNPDELLKHIKMTEKNPKGKLKIFLGYAAGVGKTYAMLDEAREQHKSGVDVVVGYVEPHSRPETIQLLEGLPIIEPLSIPYKNLILKEFDLETALKRKPQLILIDELAHTNAHGVRNRKRYQDVDELINAGIDVYTTVNVQHIESLNDIIEDITKIPVRETIPDYIFDNADKVILVDVDPDELLKRFAEGKIYSQNRTETALQNFFTIEKLRLLREIALRKTTDIISQENQSEASEFDKKLKTRFLVCVGPSPSSAKCIRWTARTADAFHAPWTAVTVESLNDKANQNNMISVRNHHDLAARLGGNQASLIGYDLAETIAEYARQQGITNIVIGKNRSKKTMRNFFKASFEDKLIELLPHTEIHIISNHIEPKKFKFNAFTDLHKHFQLSWIDNLKLIGILFLSTFISFGLRTIGIGEQNVIMVYILTVIVISRITNGYAYGIIASILSVLTFNFFFVEPYFTFSAIQPGYQITFIIMLIIALITSAMMIRVKSQAKYAISKERKTEILYDINKNLLITRGLQNIIQLTNNYIGNITQRSVIFYNEDPINGNKGVFYQNENQVDSSFMLQADEQAVAHWVFINKKRAGAGTDTLMGAGAFYMPIISQTDVLAVIGLSCVNNETINHDMRAFLRMIVALIAMALERQYLSDEQNRILVDSEKESLRSNLLRAISHDLRTPLTSILGASSAMLDNKMTKITRENLVRGINEQTEWLIRLVENLLFVTRVSDSGLKINKTVEALEEIIAEAISRVKSQHKDCLIQVNIPSELILVPMDGTLIEQVIINLLDNAIKHSPSTEPVELSVTKSGGDITFIIHDHGIGIPENELPELFEVFSGKRKTASDSSRGMGIGLNICRSIIKAHNGNISAENSPTGGAVFKFTLPMSEGDSHE